jgi:hypothetical protein
MTSTDALLSTLDPDSRVAAEAAIREQQLILIDRLVRAARTEGWCGEFERSMAVIFPNGHPDSGSTDVRAWVDSDGFTCRGITADGYGTDGLHVDTRLDREGFNRRGYDSEGFDRQGFDMSGFNREGFDVDGFNIDGFDRDQRDRGGNLAGTPEATAYGYRFDSNGYDADGFNYVGRHVATGLTRAEHANRFQYDRNGRRRPS